MGTELQDPEPSIVLFFGCNKDAGSRLGLFKADIIEAYGSQLRVIHVDLARLDWLVYPFKEESLHEILQFHFTRKSMHTALKWMESEKFVEDVRKILEERIKATVEGLPDDWQQQVTLVYLDESLEPEISGYVQRVFDGWFPNAKFRQFTSYDTSSPIWRDAEVTPIEEAHKPSLAEVLDMRCDQLGLEPSQIGSKFVNAGVVYVHDLVLLPHDGARAILGDKNEHFCQVVDWLTQHGLRFGMYEEQIGQLRESDEGKPKSLTMRLDHGFSDETLLGHG